VELSLPWVITDIPIGIATLSMMQMAQPDDLEMRARLRFAFKVMDFRMAVDALADPAGDAADRHYSVHVPAFFGCWRAASESHHHTFRALRLRMFL
jgi:hypothetical protein